MRNLLLISTILLFLMTACKPERQEIFYGQEECAHCSMIISEPQYSGQLVTSKGRHYNFDAIECMAAFMETGTVGNDDIHSLWVPDFNNDDNWLLAGDAFFLRSPNLPSPMSMNLSAYPNMEEAEEHQRSYTGDILIWSDIQNLVRQEWFNQN